MLRLAQWVHPGFQNLNLKREFAVSTEYGRKEVFIKTQNKISTVPLFYERNISGLDLPLERRERRTRGGEEDGRGQREGKMEGGQV